MSAGEGARTYTFLYTDIVGSSRLWEADPHAMASAVESHNLLIETIVEEHRGRVFKSLGDGLACVFESADSAVRSGVAIQRALASADLACPISVRVGIHSGTAHAIGRDFGGPVLNRVSRITDLAEGGQVIVSEAARSLALDYLGDSIEFEALGIIQLEGMARPESVYGILAEGLASAISLVTQTDLPPSNIEPLHHPFVGRAAERRNLVDRLKSDEQRFITVVGFGGIGKTTLARQCGLDVLESFGNQVYWIECETLRTREDLHTAILEVLDQGNDGSDAEGVLIEAIGDKRALIICDCFENMVTVGGTLERLIRRCTRLKVLVTSRIVLGSEAEHLIELKGLGSKRSGSMESDAVELFLSQARRHTLDFGATRKERDLARKLVGQVEYIPLAIVICAGRLRYTAIELLLEQVRASLLGTVRSPRGATGRHTGLARVIQMSFDLLEPRDQEVLLGLAIFEGGFTVEAATAVIRGERLSVEESIYRLRDNSLVSTGDHSRLRLLDSVREFLGDGTNTLSKEVTERYVDFFESLAVKLRRMGDDQDWIGFSETWTSEGPNLRKAALFSGMQSGRAVEFARLLCLPLLETGQYQDLEKLISIAESQAGDKKCWPINAEFLGYRAVATRRMGNFELAASLFTRQATLCRENGNLDRAADAYLDAAMALIDLGAYDLAEKNVHEADVCGDATDEKTICTSALRSLIYANRGELHYLGVEAEIALCLAVSAPKTIFFLGRVLGEAYRLAGNFNASLSVIHPALENAVEAGFPSVAGSLLIELALTRFAKGDLDCAAAALATAQGIPAKLAPRLRGDVQGILRREQYSALKAATLRAERPTGKTWKSSILEVMKRLS